MRLLVVGSCTGEKDVRDCPSSLTEADFDDPSTLPRREAELSRWALPAVRLYTGWQHRYMMVGVKAIRERFGSAACALKIISAGYGLVDEDRNLVPYEATFQLGGNRGWIKERAKKLGIPEALRRAIRDSEAVVFFAWEEYLLCTHPACSSRCNSAPYLPRAQRQAPISPERNHCACWFGGDAIRCWISDPQGKMFELFAHGLCRRPEAWNEVLTDPTAETFLRLVEEGRGRT